MFSKLDNHGLALIVSIIVMLLLSSLGVFSVSLLSTDTHISLDTLSSAQAFFIAEAGVQEVIYKLKNESAYRGDPSVVIGDIGEGSFSVGVSKDDTTYTLTSTGTVGEVSRIITQSIDVEGGGDLGFLDYVIFFGGGDGTDLSTVAKDNNITGDIYINGDIEIGKDTTITGAAIATGSISEGSGVTVTEGTFPNGDPPTDQPEFDSTYYDGEIATAASQPAGDQTISGGISGTTYVNGAVTINGDLSGSGTIVASGDITMTKENEVASGITLISGNNFAASKESVIGSNCLIYASNDLSIAKEGTILGTGESGSTLLSGGNMSIAKECEIYGFLFTEGTMLMCKETTFEGNMVGSTLDAVSKECNLTLNAELVDFSSISGFTGAGDVVVTLGGWEEETS